MRGGASIRVARTTMPPKVGCPVCAAAACELRVAPITMAAIRCMRGFRDREADAVLSCGGPARARRARIARRLAPRYARAGHPAVRSATGLGHDAEGNVTQCVTAAGDIPNDLAADA